VNSTYRPVAGAKAHVSVFNLDMTSKFDRQVPVDLDPDSAKQIITLPRIEGLSPTYFVRLDLRDDANKLVSTNFYWLSTTQETLDWSKTNYYVTPLVQHADLKALNDLPKVSLKGNLFATSQKEDVLHITLANLSKALAFAVSLRLTDAKGDDVLPVVFEDNYFSMLPGEKRTLAVQFAAKDLHGSKPVIHVEGWNVAPITLHVPPAAATH
jgi:exo-1,4-beta-D-glucosaminidase